MNIYPYVYYLEHKETKRFYFGYRCGNKVPAQQDLGTRYFTSTKQITKSTINEYEMLYWEQPDKQTAYEVEQHCIWAFWDSPNIMNKNVDRADCLKFKPNGPPSIQTRRKLSLSKTGKRFTDEHKKHLKEARNKRTSCSDAQKAKTSAALKGRVKPQETRDKLSAAMKGRKFPERRNRPVSDETRAKISQANRGRPSNKKGIPRTEEVKQKMREAWKTRRLNILT